MQVGIDVDCMIPHSLLNEMLFKDMSLQLFDEFFCTLNQILSDISHLKSVGLSGMMLQCF